MCLLLFVLFNGANSQSFGNTARGLEWSPSQQQQQVASTNEVARLRGRYLDAVRDSILGIHLATPGLKARLHNDLKQLPYDAAQRARGNDWPAYGVSMIGQLRMDNLRTLLEDVLAKGVLGSFVECGVWRGGASIFAKAVFTAHGAARDVHLVDSFQGLPPNTTTEDVQDWSQADYLRVPQPEVQGNFERFNLLDKRVHFHKGYFRYALPTWRAQDKSPIAVLRLDGDMYESTMDELYNLWDAVSPGGYVIIDDWSVIACRKAITEFFSRNNLNYKITQIDDNGAWFQKTASGPIDHDWYAKFNSSRTSDDVQTDGS
ncbi:macrocin O-methyltransferase [Chlorella sorokiniana]|uniref:Macrocin O-methyltransferase n=1 Tax=Chlorella sorokiniana TaxID=3076 RepID=A0A2P6U506_CHLSO|nr:macrocin O-methyltransferase [Chlorella sorokiniana]|eukprot:PRW61401.1 macrocin O-methyltransferase [Chlorella sorokiniana]